MYAIGTEEHYGYCPQQHKVSLLDAVAPSATFLSKEPYYLCRECNVAYAAHDITPSLPVLASRDIYIPPPKGVDVNLIAQHVREILLAIGEDPDRPGLKETPMRVARFWQEFMAYDDDNHNTTFEAIRADQMVVVTGIKTWSLCEHHLLPFSATLSVGYIPSSKEDGGSSESRILGLSKIPRIVHLHAHKLQLQERLVDDIANEIQESIKPLGVAVVSSGVHTCMVMRGIKTDGVMTTSRVIGVFRRQPEVRAEFFALVQHSQDFGRW